MRYIVVIDILAVVISICPSLLLIPRYGALGAAIGTCSTLVVHKILNHAGLWFGTSIKLFQWSYLIVYVIIGLSALGLLLIQQTTSAPIYVGLALAALAVCRRENQLPHLCDFFGSKWSGSSETRPDNKGK